MLIESSSCKKISHRSLQEWIMFQCLSFPSQHMQRISNNFWCHSKSRRQIHRSTSSTFLVPNTSQSRRKSLAVAYTSQLLQGRRTLIVLARLHLILRICISKMAGECLTCSRCKHRKQLENAVESISIRLATINLNVLIGELLHYKLLRNFKIHWIERKRRIYLSCNRNKKRKMNSHRKRLTES